MNELESEIHAAIVFGDKEQWVESEEHAKTAIQLNKRDPRGYQYAAKAATMQEANDRAFKFLQLGAARCSDCDELTTAFEKFKLQQEASKESCIERVKTIEPRKPAVVEKEEKKPSQSSPDLKPREIIDQFHRDGYQASCAGHFQKSLECLRKAHEMYKEVPKDRKMEITCKFLMILARIGVGTYEALAAAYEALVDMKKDSFPAGYYATAMILVKLNRGKQGLEFADRGLKLAKNADLDWETYFWPTVNEPIKETRRVFLREKFFELSNFCRAMPAPDAVCRLPECLSLSSHIIPCINIYRDDPDFVGYMVVRCESKCSVAYHVSCWKHYKESISELEKISDKDMLGKECPTEGCRTGRHQWRRSIITKVTVIDHDGKVKAEVEGPKSKEPDPTPNTQSEKSIKKPKPVKKPGDKVFMKPKKAIVPVESPQEKAEREKAEKDRFEKEREEREAAEKARAERVAAADGSGSGSDDNSEDDSSSYNTEDDMYDSEEEEEEIPDEVIMAMVQNARENNFFRDPAEIVFDPTRSGYGHENPEKYKAFKEISHPEDVDSKELKEEKIKLQKIFHDLLIEKGPMLKDDMVKHLQDLKLCEDPDYFLKEAIALPYFLLSTAHFCSVDEYVGLAEQMDKVYGMGEESWDKTFHYAFKPVENSGGEEVSIDPTTEKTDAVWDDEVVKTEVLDESFAKKKKRRRKEVEYVEEEDYEEALQREMEIDYESYLEDKKKMELELKAKEAQKKANNNAPVLKIGDSEEHKPIESTNTNGFGKVSPFINNLPSKSFSKNIDSHGTPATKILSSDDSDDAAFEEALQIAERKIALEKALESKNKSAMQNQDEEKIEEKIQEKTDANKVQEKQNGEESGSVLFESDSDPAENEDANESSDDLDVIKEDPGKRLLDSLVSHTATTLLSHTTEPIIPTGSCITPTTNQSALQSTSEVHDGDNSSDEQNQESEKISEFQSKLESTEQRTKSLESQLKESQKKELAAKLKIEELMQQLKEIKQEKSKLNRNIDEQANKFKQEKQSLKESAAKELETKEKQHTALKNQLVKNNETQKNQIAELTANNTLLKSTIENLNLQIEPLKTQLLGTQRRLVQELENHWGDLFKYFNDMALRNVELMYVSVKHLSEETSPSVRHMYSCIEQWEKFMARMTEMGNKFKKTTDVYDKAWKSGKIAEKKLITIQVPTPPALPDYPIENVLAIDLHSNGTIFKKVSNCTASTQTKARKTSDQGVSADIPLPVVNSIPTPAAQPGPSRSSENTGAKPKVSSASTSTSHAWSNEAPARLKEVVKAKEVVQPKEIKQSKSAESSRSSTPRAFIETSIFSSRGDVSKTNKSTKQGPPPTMADALKGHSGSSAPPVIPVKPKIRPAFKASAKKSNYQILIDELVHNNYHASEEDVCAALQTVRDRNHNKLTGLAKEEIARRVTEALLELLLERPEPEEPCYTDEDLARTLSEGPAEGEEEDCCICMERKDHRNVYLMPCKHSFHPVCLRKWLFEDKFCPMCRQTVNIKLPGHVVEFPPLRN